MLLKIQATIVPVCKEQNLDLPIVKRTFHAGSIARRFFAPHPIILQVGSTVFVHGGILPQHTEYGLERINEETREWFLGNSGPKIPAFLSGKDAVVWARDYSTGQSKL